MSLCGKSVSSSNTQIRKRSFGKAQSNNAPNDESFVLLKLRLQLQCSPCFYGQGVEESLERPEWKFSSATYGEAVDVVREEEDDGRVPAEKRYGR